MHKNKSDSVKIAFFNLKFLDVIGQTATLKLKVFENVSNF